MIKLVYDYQTFVLQEYGGISRYIFELFTKIGADPIFDARTFAVAHINNYLVLESKNIIGFKRPNMPHTTRLTMKLNSYLFRIWLELEKPHIIHQTFYHDDGTKRKDSTCRILTVYDFIEDKIRPVKSAKAIELKNAAIRKADHLICISNETKKDLLERHDVSEKSISVVHLGHEIRTKRDRQMTSLDKPYILFVGSRGCYKNFSGCLRALASRTRFFKDFVLVCFGGGKLNDEELSLASYLNVSHQSIYHFEGDDDLLADLYTCASCLIYPSLYEGFGIPVLEAMSLGCPVACSNTSSLPEVAGQSAEFFDPYDIESIVSALEHILYSTERLESLRNMGYKRAALFTWDLCARNTAQVYKSLL